MLKDGVKARWTVESFDYARRIQGIEYTVAMLDDGHYHCTCDAFKYGQGTYCKHIMWVINNKDELVPDEVNEPDILPILRDALTGDKNVTLEITHNRGVTSVKIMHR